MQLKPVHFIFLVILCFVFGVFESVFDSWQLPGLASAILFFCNISEWFAIASF